MERLYCPKSDTSRHSLRRRTQRMEPRAVPLHKKSMQSIPPLSVFLHAKKYRPYVQTCYTHVVACLSLIALALPP